MNCKPLSLTVALLWILLGLVAPSWALQIRSYSASRHDRFTGFPDAPAWNDAAWFASRKFSGVGWAALDMPYKRQFALVSPQHIVCATHYQPGLGTILRFLNSDGITVDRSVAVLTPIKNDLDQNSDLTLATLDSPLLALDKVAHFPYLNLANENAYVGTSLTVFGWQAKAGRGTISGFDDMEGAPINKTRGMAFDYGKFSGNKDDSYLEIGDSGSPTFATAGGNLVVVGTHTNIDDLFVKFVCYDTFIPHYIGKLDAVMAADGYQMTPAYPAAITLQATAATTPALWRKANSGSLRCEISNPSAATATNVTAILRFPPAAVPSTLSAPGWIITAGEPGERLLRRATLQAGATVPITAEWLDLGLGDSLNVELFLAATGSAQQTFNFNHDLVPSYNAWAIGLLDRAPAADPDGDGIANVLEYAFGGDPALASQSTAFGVAMMPVFGITGGLAMLTFVVRDDAERRGLSYVVEFSGTLATGSWSSTPPPGYALVDTDFPAAGSGCRHRAVSFNGSAPRQFCRVRVVLNEIVAPPP